MSVLIKGMEKPEHCGYCRFRYDGICHALQKTQYSMNECPLVVIDDAGLNDTISRQAAIDALKAYEDYKGYLHGDFEEILEALPSVQTEFTDSEIQKMQELEQAQIKKAYELGFEEGKESARREAWEDGRDRLD